MHTLDAVTGDFIQPKLKQEELTTTFTQIATSLTTTRAERTVQLKTGIMYKLTVC